MAIILPGSTHKFKSSINFLSGVYEKLTWSNSTLPDTFSISIASLFSISASSSRRTNTLPAQAIAF